MEYKICSKCKNKLPLSDFHKHAAHPDGYHSECKKCRGCKEIIKYTKDGYKICSHCNKELPLEDFNNQKMGYLGKRAYCRECQKYETKEYKSRPEVKQHGKEYRQTENARELRRLRNNYRKDLKRQLESNFTKSDWEKCLRYFGSSCAYCGKNEVILHQDHFVPLSKGGTYVVNNIIPACESCNCSKCNKDFNKWYPKQKFYSQDRELKIMRYLSEKGVV